MSYLASPPETPLSIDGGIEYRYVIAQQGALSMAVVADADFDFLLTFGEPAVLRLTFTGSVLATPQYKTVTVNLTLPGGVVQTHTPQFKILGTGSQRVPDITNAKSKAVAQGQSVAVQIVTDVPALVTSYSSANLPAGLSLNTATGLITGTAPETSGFSVITLIAINGSHHYKRYFVLIVGTGNSPEAQTFFAYPPGVVP